MVMEEVWRLAALLREEGGASATLGIELAAASDIEEVSAILGRHGHASPADRPLSEAELDRLSAGNNLDAYLEAVHKMVQDAIDRMSDLMGRG